MNLFLLPMKTLWFFLMVFVGSLVLSFMPIPEVPTGVSSEEVSVTEVVSVEEEEGVYVSKEVMDKLVELYYHHLEEHHHHHPEHQHHREYQEPTQNLL